MQISGISTNSVINQYDSAKTNVDGKFADDLEAAAKEAKAIKDDKKLQSVCKDFEAMFLNLMYSKMRETVPDNTLYGTSHGEKIMQSMMDTELTKNMADSGGVGLAALMYKQLSAENQRNFIPGQNAAEYKA